MDSKYKQMIKTRFPLIKRIYNYACDLSLYLCTWVGYIPFHSIRNILYRQVWGLRMSGTSILYWRCRFFKPSGVHIGDHSIVGNDAFLDGRSGLFIGNNVNIAGEVRIYTLEHDVRSATFAATGGEVRIEDWVYIGTRVTILPEVTIGEGAVVASGAVVTKDVKPWTIVAGIPAKRINKRPVVKYKLDTKTRTYFQ